MTLALAQRQQYKSGKLAPERIALLNALAGWSFDRYSMAWNEGYQALCKYLESEGDDRPAQGLLAANDYTLGSWVNAQRVLFRHNKLEPGQIAKLKELPGWSFKPQADAWAGGYQALCDYVESEGHASPPEHSNRNCRDTARPSTTNPPAHPEPLQLAALGPTGIGEGA
jgi:hypothetical protein